MRIKKIIFFYCIMFISCSAKKQFTVIDYIENQRKITSDSHVENNANGFKIVFSDDLTLYEIHNVVYNINTINKGDSVINEIVPTNDTAFRYFIVAKDNMKGLRYDSLDVKRPEIFRLDSLKEILGITTENMRIFSLDLGTPTEIVRNSKTHRIEIEKFFAKKEKGEADSIYRYYDDRLIDVNFSISPLLDKKNNSKLYKTQFIYLPQEANYPRIEETTEIRKIKVGYEKRLSLLFERFNKDSKNIDLK